MPSRIVLGGQDGVILEIADTSAAVSARRKAIPDGVDSFYFTAEQAGALKLGNSDVDASSSPFARLEAGDSIGPISAVFKEDNGSGRNIYTRATHLDFVSSSAGYAYAFEVEVV